MLTEQQLLDIFCQCCGRGLAPDTELMESGILDSLSLIMLAEALEERGIVCSIARVPRESLTTVRSFSHWLARQIS